jgi:hypothetical protein
MACLIEPLEASLASRIFFLRGFVELETGRQPEAREAFDRAVLFAPELEWDERFPPTGQPLLKEAREALAAATPGVLVLGPGLQQATALWVDGQPAIVEDGHLSIKPGVHLVQMLQPTVVTLPLHIGVDRAVAIVDAQAMAQTPLASLLGTIELQALLEQEFGSGTPIWFYAGENTWRLDSSWSELPKSDAVLHAERAIVGQKLARSGVGVLGVGMVGGAVSWTIIGSNYKADASETRASYETRQARVNATAPWAYTTSGIALGGLAVAVTGWALLDGRVRVGPGPMGLPGVTLQAAFTGL